VNDHPAAKPAGWWSERILPQISAHRLHILKFAPTGHLWPRLVSRVLSRLDPGARYNPVRSLMFAETKIWTSPRETGDPAATKMHWYASASAYMSFLTGRQRRHETPLPEESEESER